MTIFALPLILYYIIYIVYLGENRTHYPLTCYLVAGTQAEAGRQNFIVMMKMSNMRQIQAQAKHEGMAM